LKKIIPNRLNKDVLDKLNKEVTTFSKKINADLCSHLLADTQTIITETDRLISDTDKLIITKAWRSIKISEKEREIYKTEMKMTHNNHGMIQIIHIDHILGKKKIKMITHGKNTYRRESDHHNRNNHNATSATYQRGYRNSYRSRNKNRRENNYINERERDTGRGSKSYKYTNRHWHNKNFPSIHESNDRRTKN